MRAELLKTYWTVVGPTRCPIRCALYRTDAGLELRTHRGTFSLLYFLPVFSEDQGRERAAAWRREMLQVAGYAEAKATPFPPPNPLGNESALDSFAHAPMHGHG